MSKEKRIRTLKAWVEEYRNNRLVDKEIEIREEIANSVVKNRSRLRDLYRETIKNRETLQKKE